MVFKVYAYQETVSDFCRLYWTLKWLVAQADTLTNGINHQAFFGLMLPTLKRVWRKD